MLTALVIGAGWIARRVHLPFLSSNPQVGRVLVSDVDAARADAAAHEFGAERHDGSVATAAADLVVVCTPPATHAEYVLAALELGQRVICEKPLALTTADARAITAAAAASRGAVHVCFTNRYHAAVRALARLAASGAVGTPARVEVSWVRRNGIPGSPGARDVGVVWDLGSHLVDIALLLTRWKGAGSAYAEPRRWGGEESASRWYAAADREMPPPSHDTAVGEVTFSGSRTIALMTSWDSDVAHDEVVITLRGTAGAARVRTLFGFSPDRVVISGPALVTLDRNDAIASVEIAGQPREPREYHDQLDAFLAGLDAASLEQSCATTTVVEALAESIASGRVTYFEALR